MNTKVVLGIFVACIVIVGGFFFLRPTSAPTGITGVTKESAASTTQTPLPRQSVGTYPQTVPDSKKPEVKVSSSFVQFDSLSFVSTSTYPTVTGTASTPSVGIIISDSEGTGIVGTTEIPVRGGKWSYSCSVSLVPGAYTLTLFSGDASAAAKLTVKES